MAGMPGGVSLFVYGTLMDEERLHRLTGRRFARRGARLEGYARRAHRGGYPTVVPWAVGCVDGLLIEDVDPASLRVLDRYEDEGRLYVRRPVEVTSGGRRIVCEAYLGVTSAGSRGRGRRRRRASDG